MTDAEEKLQLRYDSDDTPVHNDEQVSELLVKCKKLQTAELLTLSDQLFDVLLSRHNVESPGDSFVSMSVNAMLRLQHNGKSNVVYKLPQIVAQNRPGTQLSRIPLDRMPWGLIQYQIDFFASKHTNEVILTVKIQVVTLCN